VCPSRAEDHQSLANANQQTHKSIGEPYRVAICRLRSFVGTLRQFVLGQRGPDDSRADRVDARATLTPPHGLGHNAQRIPAFRELIGVQRVFHLIALENRQLEQFVDRRKSQRLVLFDRERG
jgi:hypothetical protein